MRERIGRRIGNSVTVAFVLFVALGLIGLYSARSLVNAGRKEDLMHKFRGTLYQSALDLSSLHRAEAALLAAPTPESENLVRKEAARLRDNVPRLTEIVDLDARLLFNAEKCARALKDRVALAEQLAAAPPDQRGPISAEIAKLESTSGVGSKLVELIQSLEANIQNLNRQTERFAKIAFTLIWLSVIVSCTVIVIGGLRLTRKVTDPINSLIAGVEKVREEENLSYRIPVISSDETGRLTEEFNRLLDRLETANRQHKELYEVAKTTNGELKEFAYVISHDLKAPLRGIASLSSWLVTDHGGKLDDEGKEILDLLLARVQRMHDLIDGVLQYSRAGRQKEQMVDTDLNRLVEDAIQLVEVPESIKVTIENRLPTIFCEPTRITQVFQNLLSNAVKFMDKPEGQVRISSEDAGEYWQFSVADNGPGIESKYHEKIFQIFQTLRTDEDFDSTGIGLSVVKKIIKLYGGSIWVESVPGAGATFVFKLPKRAFHVMDII